MHIPDGFMSVKIAVFGWILALPSLAWALYATRDEDGQATTLGALLAACLFAAQTFHFPVPGGTSGHLVGAALVMILCGLPLGFLILTSVIVLQAVVFGDGGLMTMGWNLNNMGLATGFVGASLFFALQRWKAPLFASAFVSAWMGTMLGAVCTALELAFADITPLAVSLPTMLTVQALTGVGEGLVTAGVLVFLARTRPSLLNREQGLVWPGLLVSGLIFFATLAPPRVFGLEAGQYPALLVVSVLLCTTVLVALILRYLGRR
jgi:cobalt/nickel transport system permease protein